MKTDSSHRVDLFPLPLPDLASMPQRFSCFTAFFHSLFLPGKRYLLLLEEPCPYRNGIVYSSWGTLWDPRSETSDGGELWDGQQEAEGSTRNGRQIGHVLSTIPDSGTCYHTQVSRDAQWLVHRLNRGRNTGLQADTPKQADDCKKPYLYTIAQKGHFASYII